MKPFLLLLVLLLVVPAIGHENVFAQSKADLVGTWKLISAIDTTDKGQVIENAYGLNPTGFLTYAADGRMMAIVTNGGRKPLSVLDRISAPAKERAEAFATMVAYGGRYTLSGDKVIHHVEVATMQNVVGTDLVRTIVKFEGKRVTLRTPLFSRAGLHVVDELVWERMN
jgi:Lipocalin-like domain